MRTLIQLALFLSLLGQLTPRLQNIISVYQIDLLTNFQVQFAILSVVLSVILGGWNRTVMVIFLLVSGLLIASNFNGYLNGQYVVTTTKKLVTHGKTPALKVLQYTFDDSIDASLGHVYRAITKKNADLIILFNVNELHLTYLNALSEQRFSYGIRSKENMPSNMAVISKFPISSKHKTSFLDERGDLVSLNIVVNTATLAVSVMHPPKPTTPVNWRRRNLMLNMLETQFNNADNVTAYTLVVSEMYTSVWSDHFPNLINLRSCTHSMGLYGSWYPKLWLKSFAGLGAISTSHCFLSYRLKVNSLEVDQITNAHHNIISYGLSIPNER